MPHSTTGHHVFDLNPSPTNPRNSEGAFATLGDGRIVFSYSHFTGGKEDHAFGHLASRYSSDGGRTWTTEDTPLRPNEGMQTTMSVGYVRLATGALALFYLIKNSDSDCRLHMRTSSDEGNTWSNRVLCHTMEGYHVTNNDREHVLSNGRLIAPTSYHGMPMTLRAEAAYMWYSDDLGATWQASEPVPQPSQGNSGLQEPEVVELRGGRLWMLCRTDLGHQWQSYSEDGGVRWSPPQPCEHFAAPTSPISIKRIPHTGDLLAIWNDHSGRFPLPPPETHAANWRRTPLVSAISRDDGRTWQHHRLLESDFEHGYCYTAIHFTGDAVLLAYCAGGPDCGWVLSRARIRRVPVAWFYATSGPCGAGW
jgi:hypothetical protein